MKCDLSTATFNEMCEDLMERIDSAVTTGLTRSYSLRERIQDVIDEAARRGEAAGSRRAAAADPRDAPHGFRRI